MLPSMRARKTKQNLLITLRIMGILAPQIDWAGTFIVYITPKTKGSAWVDWEIEYAAKQGKR